MPCRRLRRSCGGDFAQEACLLHVVDAAEVHQVLLEEPAAAVASAAGTVKHSVEKCKEPFKVGMAMLLCL